MNISILSWWVSTRWWKFLPMESQNSSTFQEVSARRSLTNTVSFLCLPLPLCLVTGMAPVKEDVMEWGRESSGPGLSSAWHTISWKPWASRCEISSRNTSLADRGPFCMGVLVVVVVIGWVVVIRLP